MKNRNIITVRILLLWLLAATGNTWADSQEGKYLSPCALAMSPDGQRLYVGCATARQVGILDVNTRKISGTVAVPGSPSGLALSSDGTRLLVTCAAPESIVCLIDTGTGTVLRKLPAGHTATAPVLSPDEGKLYVCNRFDNEVAVMDLHSGRVTARVRVPREPISAAVTLDGKFLLVANHIQAGRADVDVVASCISVIDLAANKVCREIALPSGSTLLRDIRVSPNGRHAIVAHSLGRFHLPTTQVERGWVNSSAVSLIDVPGLKLINTVLLDNIDAGAANPWAVGWSKDGSRFHVSHAGTHELSIVDFPALLRKLANLEDPSGPPKLVDYAAASHTTADVPNDLSFLVGLRKRVRLAEGDRGPRALVLAEGKAYLANYFSDTISVVDVTSSAICVSSIPLQPAQPMSVVRRGELLFNDATICFQGWQSCSSCHSSDARVDGLNWDNLNDGIGNPKSAKSLLLAHQTSPSMWLGVRANAEVSVRAGIRNSMFTVRPEKDALALDAYLKSLRPIPSPRLVHGQLSSAAKRGRKLFFSEAVGCADCHKGELYNDQKFHDVGTVGKFDKPSDRFDTPSLVEVWRSGPYLHDGRAANIREVITTFNQDDKHGNTSQLSPGEIDDLVEFVLSL